MNKISIVALVGSLRKDSYNLQLAKAVKKLLEGQAELEILDYKDVPFFNEDLEFPAPEAVTRLRERVKVADAVWFFTPEYNHSFPGVFKNVIDWLSRPVSKAEGQVLSGKPAVVSGASLSTTGSAIAQDQLVMLLSFLNMDIMNYPRVAIPQVFQQLDGEGRLALSETSTDFLEKQVKSFVAFVQKRKGS